MTTAKKNCTKATMTLDERMARDADAPTALSSELLHRITAAASALKGAQWEVERAEEVLKQAKERMRELRERVLPALLDEAQVQSLGLQDEEGTVVERGEDVYASIAKDKAAAACAWLDANGYGALIKSEIVVEAPRGDRATALAAIAALRKAHIEYAERSTVHPQTLKAFVRESLEEGRKLSPDITYHTVPVVELKVKRARKKKAAQQQPPLNASLPEF